MFSKPFKISIFAGKEQPEDIPLLIVCVLEFIHENNPVAHAKRLQERLLRDIANITDGIFHHTTHFEYHVVKCHSPRSFLDPEVFGVGEVGYSIIKSRILFPQCRAQCLQLSVRCQSFLHVKF